MPGLSIVRGQKACQPALINLVGSSGEVQISLQVPLSSSGWAGKQTAKHWMCGILRAALGLRLCWGWPGVEAAAGYLWCACRTAAAQESQLAHPWPVVPCSAPGSPIGPHNLGRGQTGTDKKGVLSSGQGSGKHSGFIFDP